MLLLHGTGGDESSLLPFGRKLAPKAGILSPRGNVIERGMPRFFRRLSPGVFDMEDLFFRSRELAEFVHLASDIYGFDPHGVVAVGHSNGANIAASVLLLGAFRFPAAVLFRPMIPFFPEKSPKLAGSSLFLSAGRHDPIVPPAHPQKLQQIFETAGASVTVNWESAGHNLTSREVEAASVWLKEEAGGRQ